MVWLVFLQLSLLAGLGFVVVVDFWVVGWLIVVLTCAFGLLLFGSPVVALNVVFSACRLFLKMLNSLLSSSLFTLSLELCKDGQPTFPPDIRGVGSIFDG